MNENQERPISWMVATAVFAALAIGFAIWAFTLRSDGDDTQAALDSADATVQDEAAQLSDEERTAAAVEAAEQAFGERFQQRYRAVRKRFVAEGKQVDELQSDVEQRRRSSRRASRRPLRPRAP
jgi:hypothetical protein